MKITNDEIKIVKRALISQKQMRDINKPKKLDESLCWLDNESLADEYYEQALKILEKKDL